MREEARHERQRDTHRALYESFAAGQGLPIAEPSDPELTGLGHYATTATEQTDQLEPDDQASPVTEVAEQNGGENTNTRFLPAVAPIGTEQISNFAANQEFTASALSGATRSSAKREDREKTRRKRNSIMVATIVIFALILAGSIFVVKALYKQFNPDDYPGPGTGAVEFTVEDGWGLNLISKKLQEKDVISNDKLFTKAVEDSDGSNKYIHPGTYLLKSQMSAADAAKELVNNKPGKVFYIGLKANMRLGAALEEIAKSSGLKIADLEKLANQPEKFGLPASVKNLEGWLHPGEYRFALDSSAKEVLSKLVKDTKTTLKDAGITDLNQGYRTLKVASILQAESREKDYATVAGAIENRLKSSNKETHGLLQVDSAVVYGLGRYSLQFSKDEKQDKANKYNTYVHAGLPPTPIGSPATAAIKAAAHPEENGFYYWVTVNIKTGETKFASTYAEHQKNHAQFRQWCSDNPGYC